MSGASEEMQNPGAGRAVGDRTLWRDYRFLLHFLRRSEFCSRSRSPTSVSSRACRTPSRKIFGAGISGNIPVIVLCVMTLYTLIANMTTWTIGANRSAAEAAGRGDLPSIFGKLHPVYKTPANSAILCGVIARHRAAHLWLAGKELGKISFGRPLRSRRSFSCFPTSCYSSRS